MKKDRVYLLHISDIHRAPASNPTNGVLFGALREDLGSFAAENARLSADEPHLCPPDLIIVSGDLTRTGTRAEYEEARLFLEQLLPWVGGRRERVVVVPGNHDVNWDLAARAYKRATAGEYNEQERLGPSSVHLIKKSAGGRSFWRKDPAQHNNRLRPFKAFFDEFYQGQHHYALESEKMFTVFDFADELGIVIVGYNSCDEIDAYKSFGRKPRSLDRRGVICQEAIYNADSQVSFHREEKDLLRIAVFHHNIRSIDYDEDFLDPVYLGILRKQGVQLCVHGHVHKPDQDLYDSTKSHPLPVVGAGSLAAPYPDRPPATPMSYNLIVADSKTKGIWVHTRKSDERNLAWQPDYRWEGKSYYVARRPDSESFNHDNQTHAVTPEQQAAFCVAMLDELRAWYRTRDEVSDLCLYMNLAYDNLSGKGPSGKLRELLRALKSRDEIDRLLRKCQQDYRRGKWPTVPPNIRSCP